MFPRRIKGHPVKIIITLSTLLLLLYTVNYQSSETSYTIIHSEEYAQNISRQQIANNEIVIKNITGKALVTRKLGTVPNPENVVNPHNFNYVINNENLCSEVSELAYVVYVHAGPNNYERRQFMRNTWARPGLLKDYPSKLVFFMGLPKEKDMVTMIVKENDQYQDIVMEDFMDAYKNMTYKAIAAFKWFTVYCSNVKYLLKVDDDIYVNIFRLMTLITQFDKHERFFYCALWLANSMPILRNPKHCAKWCAPSDFLPGERDYPQYCSGSAYLFTQDVTADLYNASLYTPYFFIDDAYATGLLPPKVSPQIKFHSAGPETYNFGTSNLMMAIEKKTISNKSIVIHTKEHLIALWSFTIKELTENEKNMMTPEKYAEIKQQINI